MKYALHAILVFFLLSLAPLTHAEDGYELWLRYHQVSSANIKAYRTLLRSWTIENKSPTADVVNRELLRALPGLLASPVTGSTSITQNGLIIGTVNSPSLTDAGTRQALGRVGAEGFVIRSIQLNKKKVIAIAGKDEAGMLYGVFHFLRLLQGEQDISNLAIESTPRTRVRILNHWDNLDRTVERGYAGFSIWDWHRLPLYLDPRYTDYARANASLGINGTVLTNVNANALVLTPHYLEKVKALADLFRPYGIRVYLTARFSAPMELGGLKTADPLDAEVQQWWREKVSEIYRYIPDFGGFTVKANSEGQPGPQNYNRSHADGANLLADALTPYGGIVMWRAFVYDNNVPVDRTKQAYNEFKPLDGKFRDNVLIQTKNGPLDFQPREPFHPLFGAMPKTSLMMEFQITQEYLGFATHWVYLATLFKECLDADTYANGPGSTVAKAVDGSLHSRPLSGMAGVANIGNDRNWCGHPMAQSNWYAFGRLAWDPSLPAEAIADEWVRMTFGNRQDVVTTIADIMMRSREITVQYMTPLGLHHIMGYNHHYGPGPWVSNARADWTSVYYHRADHTGLGFDRSPSGSNALEQYAEPVRNIYARMETCPEKYLMWFHHVPWDHPMRSGKTLWEELCLTYQAGADSVQWMRDRWSTLGDKVDAARFNQVSDLLKIQHEEAKWWRDACVLYFQSFSKRAFPQGVEKPPHTLEYYQELKFPFAPGIRPRW